MTIEKLTQIFALEMSKKDAELAALKKLISAYDKAWENLSEVMDAQKAQREEEGL